MTFFLCGFYRLPFPLVINTQGVIYTNLQIMKFANNGICNYWNLAVNQLSRNLKLLEFEGKLQFQEEYRI